MSSISDQGQILTSAATITARLSEALSTARNMSLGVLNAKAISVRAGDVAKGFQALTVFIDEMTSDVVSTIRGINQASLSITRMAMHRSRLRSSRQRFYTALEHGKDASHIHSLDRLMVKLDDDYTQLNQQLIDELIHLDDLLDDILASLRPAGIIAANSRIEASRAQNVRANLEVVADSLDESAKRIQEIVMQCKKDLNVVRAEVIREGIS